jgi:hypothetical protein
MEVIGETQENPSAGRAKWTEANSVMQYCALTDSWCSSIAEYPIRIKMYLQYCPNKFLAATVK